LTELPGVPDFVDGIFDLRGVVIPVIDLAKWMGVIVPSTVKIKPRIIITEFNNVLVGFIVHEAKRIRRISWRSIEPSSFSSVGTGGVDKSKITGVTRIENNEVLLILDLESVIAELGLYEAEVETNHKIDKFSGIALALDDSMIARRLVKDALENMGFSVVEAKDGEEGIEKLEELYKIYGGKIANELKIIISDVEMPKMNGFYFSKLVKDDNRFKDIPIVFNSSISDDFSTQRGQDAGGDEYLVKFDATTFYDKVAALLKHKKEEKEE
jgi:two-component system chemotaxis response regulator CheV